MTWRTWCHTNESMKAAVQNVSTSSRTSRQRPQWTDPLLLLLITRITCVNTWITMITTSWWHTVAILTLHSGLCKRKAELGIWWVWFVACMWMMVYHLQYAVQKYVKEVGVAIITCEEQTDCNKQAVSPLSNEQDEPTVNHKTLSTGFQVHSQ